MSPLRDEFLLEYIRGKAKRDYNIVRNFSIVHGIERQYHPQTHLFSKITEFCLKSINYLDDNHTIEIISNLAEYKISLANEKEFTHSGEQIIFSDNDDIIAKLKVFKPK